MAQPWDTASVLDGSADGDRRALQQYCAGGPAGLLREQQFCQAFQ